MDYPLLTSAAYALLYLRSSRQPPARVLEGTGLTEATLMQREYVEFEPMARLLRNIEAAGAEPGWAVRVGAQLNIGTHGPLGFAALSAPTLGAALKVMAEYHPVRITTLAAELRTQGRQVLFSMRDLSGDAHYHRVTSESILRVLEALVETIVGHPVGDYVTIRFPWPAPNYVAELEHVYGARCEFDADAVALVIPASWTHLPSPLYDESSYRANIAKCRQVISRLAPSSNTAEQVRGVLASHFDQVRAGTGGGHPAPGLEELAQELHSTPRTLIRRLKRQATSYRELLESEQLECADALLQQASLSVADVAERMGYSDPANFGRAFRKLTGVSPAAWRRGLRR
ncbi:MAG: AraC family transcriptional regulator ligand-binding domain-containing protein [Halieaceae bacterium]|jgi:AraC-like DNA-binding protein|nr:AraC family transcriptional regulator ligand-binding domain-containing protein [Halieaceae bacterium]